MSRNRVLLGLGFAATLLLSGNAFAQATQTTVPVTTKAQAYVTGSYGTSFATQSSTDNTGVLGAAIGVDFGHVRTELGYNRFLGENNASPTGKVSGDVLSARVLLEGDIGKLTPYAGVGIGYGWFSGSGLTRKDNDGVLAEGILGVNYNFTQNWSAGLNYTYYRAMDTNVRTPTGNEKFDAHVGTLQATYKF